MKPGDLVEYVGKCALYNEPQCVGAMGELIALGGPDKALVKWYPIIIAPGRGTPSTGVYLDNIQLVQEAERA